MTSVFLRPGCLTSVFCPSPRFVTSVRISLSLGFVLGPGNHSLLLVLDFKIEILSFVPFLKKLGGPKNRLAHTEFRVRHFEKFPDIALFSKVSEVTMLTPDTWWCSEM